MFMYRFVVFQSHMYLFIFAALYRLVGNGMVLKSLTTCATSPLCVYHHSIAKLVIHTSSHKFNMIWYSWCSSSRSKAFCRLLHGRKVFQSESIIIKYPPASKRFSLSLYNFAFYTNSCWKNSIQSYSFCNATHPHSGAVNICTRLLQGITFISSGESLKDVYELCYCMRYESTYMETR